MGLMTEKKIAQDKSTSLHGQGLTGEWGETRLTLRATPEDRSTSEQDANLART